jgi:hypothetical protein
MLFMGEEIVAQKDYEYDETLAAKEDLRLQDVPLLSRCHQAENKSSVHQVT